MAAQNRAARVRRTRAGLHLAGARSSAAVCRRCRSQETCAAVAKKLPVRLGNEPAQNSRGNPALSRDLEKTFRPMKKILLTIVQLVVTIGLLYWVYHDPKKLADMRQAITHARFEWLAAGILAYAIVEAAAAFRWHVLLK